jgi:hypothetical protein
MFWGFAVVPHAFPLCCPDEWCVARRRAENGGWSTFTAVIAGRWYFPGSGRRKGSCLEHVEHPEALEVGDGCRKQGLQAGFSPASVAGFAHPEALEMVDLSLHFGPPAQ